MEPHPVDVVVLYPAFFEALADVFALLVEQGLEIYPLEGQWYWRWRTMRLAASCGSPTMGAALATALAMRLQSSYPAGSAEVN
jgi:hypothetical protein